MTFPPPSPTATFPYRVLGRVGEGAMGVVYRASEPALERTVAIKALKVPAGAPGAEEPDLESRLRFLQEARAAAALSHPGTTTIFRIGDEEGTPYIAMEWLEGETLESLLRREGPLPAARVVRLGVELLEALDAAHRAGVVHRDIKPANLVLLRDGRLKVTDFGIARLHGSDLVKTQAGVVLATPRFASPEQLRGDEVDGRSDLFSTGILLFHLLTADFPFGGKDFLQVASAIFRDPPVPVRTLAPHVPEALAAVLARALEKDREERFPTALAMRDALAAAAAAPPVEVGREILDAPTLVALKPPAAARAGLPLAPEATAVAVATAWPSKALKLQPTQGLLERLLDRPVHAAPFAGAVRLGHTVLFLADGLLLAALDERSGERGDAALEALPESAEATLHPAPEALGAAGTALVASLLHPPAIRQDGLDSSYVNLPALAGKLRDEGFDGILRLERSAEALGYVLLVDGREAATFFAGDWRGLPVDGPWQDLVGGVPLRGAVLESRRHPLALSFERELRDREARVDRGGKGKAPAVALAPSPAPLHLDPAADPMLRFLAWSLSELRPFFRAQGREGKWKYLAEWLDDVQSARLHHALPRPGSPLTDPFDLATFDAGGRVLHLVQRVARASAVTLSEFRERVVAAKTARIKAGDVGGAILVARAFDPEALEIYRAGGTALSGSGRWTFGVEESLTGYEGFVRVGPRRGFHLLLVQETDEGYAPLLP